MKMINVVRWQIDETNYVDMEGGQVPTKGDAVSLHIDGATRPAGDFIVDRVGWFVDGSSTRGYHRCIAVAYLQRATDT